MNGNLAKASEGRLIFRGVHKSFGSTAVINGLFAELPLSGMTFVVGQSGGGKSVLCRLAVGLLRPELGEIYFDGVAVHSASREALRHLRSTHPYLVQGPALLDWRTVEENVALAARRNPRAPQLAREALERLGLGELAGRMPSSLGPGLKKRVAIARALVLQPRFLLLDEPTTGLDRTAASQVHETLKVLVRSGVGALVVSHDHRALEEMADRVLEVAGGRTAFLGEPDAFLRMFEARQTG